MSAPAWLVKERADWADGKISSAETWDYLRGKGVPYDDYNRMKTKEYNRTSTPEWLIQQRADFAAGKVPYAETWDYLRGRGERYEHYNEMMIDTHMRLEREKARKRK